MHPTIKILEKINLSSNWYFLNKFRYTYQNRKGESCIQEREVYDRGNGATILLYNREQRTVVLVQQFRMPTYVNGNSDGLLWEVCAGLLDKDDPVTCIKKEAMEETGYQIDSVQKIMEAYMSPGSVTEKLYYFIAAYTPADKVNNGGGVAAEQEEVEVREFQFEEALQMVADGRIQDAKTIILLQYAQLHHLFD